MECVRSTCDCICLLRNGWSDLHGWQKYRKWK